MLMHRVLLGGIAAVRKVPESPAEVDRLDQEQDWLAKAAHPGVVQALDAGGDGSLCTRDVGPRSLRDCGLIPPAEIAGLGAAAATVLADLHDLGIAHGCPTDDHVLIDDAGRPVLCSLGRATACDPIAAAHDVRVLAEALAGHLGGHAPRRLRSAMRRATSPGRPLPARSLASRLAGAVAEPRLPAMAGAPGSASAASARPAASPETEGVPDSPEDLQTPITEVEPSRRPEPSRPPGRRRGTPAQARGLRPTAGREAVERTAGAKSRRGRPARWLALAAAGGLLALLAVLAALAISRWVTGSPLPRTLRAGAGVAAGPAGRPERSTPSSADRRVGSVGGGGTRTRHRASPALGPHPPAVTPCPPVDARCGPVPVRDGVFTADGRRWALSAPADLVVLGRWTCGPALPAALDRQDGSVWVFPHWGVSTGRLAAEVPGAASLRVVPGADGCDTIAVLAAGRPPRDIGIIAPGRTGGAGRTGVGA
ncbi:MAG: serine/threonine-protein kinase [Acidimicrobiales bacterium]